MANIAYVDWDGLVYYDGKIKAYISDAIQNNMNFGGILEYESLPDPSQNNLNYLYKITNSFVSTDERFDVVEKFPFGAFVLCVQTDTNEFKYTIVNSAVNINDLISELKEDLREEFVSYETLYSSEMLIECGGADVEAVRATAEYIIDNKLPAFTNNSNELAPDMWQVINVDTVSFDKTGFYSKVGRCGYQIRFKGNDELIPQEFAIPASAEIIAAYRYDEGLNEWLPQEAPPSMEWNKSTIVIVDVNHTEYEYQTYTYDVGSMGNALLHEEYWRFDIGG